VVIHSSTNTLSVLMADGKGGFKAPVDYPTGKNPTLVSVGDVNGDGFLDLVVFNSGDNTIGVYFNKGDGTFSAPPSALVSQGRPHVSSTVHSRQQGPQGEDLDWSSTFGQPDVGPQILSGLGIYVPVRDLIVNYPYQPGVGFAVATVLKYTGYLASVGGLSFLQPFGRLFGILGDGPGGIGPLFAVAPLGANGAPPSPSQLPWDSFPGKDLPKPAPGSDGLQGYSPSAGSTTPAFYAWLATVGGVTYVIVEVMTSAAGNIATVESYAYPLPPSCTGDWLVIKTKFQDENGSPTEVAPPEIVVTTSLNPTSSCILQGDGKGGFSWA
jgi:hypothetical protein